MKLVRWEPFADLDELLEWGAAPLALARRPRLLGGKGTTFEWSPVADISETDDEYLVKAELPGVKREEVKITLQDGVITITGERKEEKSEKDEKRHRVERFYGTFTRSFSLPENVDESGIRAESKDGVLCVHIPKSKAEKPKTVQIPID